MTSPRLENPLLDIRFRVKAGPNLSVLVHMVKLPNRLGWGLVSKSVDLERGWLEKMI
jgi:hypothetical protein